MSTKTYHFILDPAPRFTWQTRFFRCNSGANLCMEGVHEHIELPRNVRNLYMVFTDRPRADSFTITPRGRLTGLKPGTMLLDGFVAMLRANYRLGYRYLHFEYGRG